MESENQKKPQKVEEMREILTKCRQGNGMLQFGAKGALEIILKYVFRKSNSEELSEIMIERFGSFQGILSADYAELCEIEGFGKSEMVYLSIIGDIFRFQGREVPTNKSFKTFNSSVRFCIRIFKNYVKETMLVIYADDKFQPTHVDEIYKKTYNHTTFSARFILSHALRYNAKKVILAHNHPNGIIMPSSMDFFNTRKIAIVLAEVEIHLSDHIIVCGNDFRSLRRSGYLDEIPE